ncbi:MAG: SprB repeat-containing protein, partial [Saprospiraceae bacterium]
MLPNSTSATITEPSELSLSKTVVDATCGTCPTVPSDLTVSGGTNPYTYAWSEWRFTTQDISNLLAGTYTVTVTDNNGCTKSLTATVNNLDGPTLSETHVDVLCHGGNDGSINLSVSGGTSPYTYNWSNGATTPDIGNLTAGNYCVTVTDANTCTATICVTISEPPALNLTKTKVDVSCFGGSDGSIDLTVSGGTSPYTYAWSNGATTEDISNLSVGTYTVTVTDNHGCVKTTSMTINQPTDLSLSKTKVNVSCYGGSDGSIDLSVSGGTSPYSYNWSNGATTQDISNLSAGTYTVTVTDNHGCTKSTSATITEPSELSLSKTVVDATCGLSNGSIDLTVSGGTNPYSYAWSNGATTQDVSNLLAGTYTVTVTDNNGCTKSLTATVNNLDGPTLSETHVDVLCHGGNNGSINLSVSGGTSPYSYNWSNGASTQDIGNLTAGNYCVTVTDANTCTATMCVTISEPPALNLSTTVV